MQSVEQSTIDSYITRYQQWVKCYTWFIASISEWINLICKIFHNELQCWINNKLKFDFEIQPIQEMQLFIIVLFNLKLIALKHNDKFYLYLDLKTNNLILILFLYHLF